MQMDWILNPLALYGMLAAAMVACVAPFFVVRAEMRAAQRRSGKSKSAVAARLEKTELAMQRVRQARVEGGELSAAPLPGLNLKRRSQAVRMHERGEPVATIAAALSAPRFHGCGMITGGTRRGDENLFPMWG